MDEWDAGKARDRLVSTIGELGALYYRIGFPREFIAVAGPLLPRIREAAKSNAPSGALEPMLVELQSAVRFDPALDKPRRDMLLGMIDRARTGASHDISDLTEAVEEAVDDWGDWHTQQQKDALDHLLWELVYVEHENKPTEWSFAATIAEQTSIYLHSPFMHTPWLTRRLAIDLLRADLSPVAEEASAFYDPAHVWGRLPGLWGVIVPGLISLAFTLGCLALAFVLYSADSPWLAGVVLVYLAWRAVMRVLRRRELARIRGRMSKIAATLQIIHQELSSGFYDVAGLRRRLMFLERRGVFVHSLMYPLLDLLKLSTTPGPGATGVPVPASDPDG